MSRILREVEALGADAVWFMKRGDGQWQAHVRHPGCGPSLYALCTADTLTEAVQGVLDANEPDIEDLI